MKMAETHLSSSELALELTKLTLQYRTASNTSWVTLANDPEKWPEGGLTPFGIPFVS
jgi:hypothetical protein